MERRVYKRIPANIEVKFFCCSTLNHGTVTNLSEKGMFISTNEMCLPFDSQFEIFFPLKEKKIGIPVMLKRIVMEPDSNDGIAVELLNTSNDYLEIVNNLRSVV
jgi:hypothetical protein